MTVVPPERQSRLERLGYEVIGYEPEPVRVERYRSELHRELWDEFLPRTACGNLFQTRRFLAYHPAGRFEDHSLLFWKGNVLVAVAAGESSDDRWSSHRFVSHAGLAVLPRLSAAGALDIVHGLLAYADANGWHTMTMRFVADALAEHAFTTITWALEVLGFLEDGREMAWCVLPAFDDEEALLSEYHPSARRGIRRAQRAGLRVCRSDDYVRFWDVLVRNLDTRFGTAPTHSLDEMTRIRTLCDGEVELHVVLDRADRIVAGTVVFDVSATGSHCFYFAQDYSTAELRPMPLLMHAINHEYVVRRRRRLNYGVFTARGATELNLSLSRFKSEFASVPSIRRRFTWRRNA